MSWEHEGIKFNKRMADFKASRLKEVEAIKKEAAILARMEVKHGVTPALKKKKKELQKRADKLLKDTKKAARDLDARKTTLRQDAQMDMGGRRTRMIKKGLAGAAFVGGMATTNWLKKKWGDDFSRDSTADTKRRKK